MSTRDFLEKDYYAVLGVPKDADAGVIKKAYRKLARELHPDAKPGDTRAEERFKEVSEAYDVLSDADRRKEYDEARALFGSGRPGGFRVPGGGGAGGGAGGFDLGDLLGGAAGRAGGGFGDIFGGVFGRGGRAAAQPRRGRDVETEVNLDFREAVEGVTVPLRLAAPHTCGTCQGSGAAPGTTVRTCPVCLGAGMVNRNAGGFGFSEPCRECRGRGQVVDAPCPTCSGSGTALGERTLTVRIPAGVEDAQRIRIAGKGSPGDSGGPAGDLFVIVHVTPHPLFGRRDKHLTITVPVTFPEAALGADVTVPTLSGETVTLRVPPGTGSGRTFRVRGRGVPAKAGTGDLLVTVEVRVPAALSDEAREALAAYSAAVPEDPRQALFGVAGRA